MFTSIPGIVQLNWTGSKISLNSHNIELYVWWSRNLGWFNWKKKRKKTIYKSILCDIKPFPVLISFFAEIELLWVCCFVKIISHSLFLVIFSDDPSNFLLFVKIKVLN